MKKILFILLIISSEIYACDVCGCMVSTDFRPVLPQFNRSLLGLHSQFANSRHPLENFNSNDPESRVLEDQFYINELRLRYFANERWQLLARVPYRIHRRMETRRVSSIAGVGDIVLHANYRILSPADSSQNWKKQWIAGFGLSLPTGKYQQRDETRLMLPALFQIGSGAFAYHLQSIYTIRYKNWGVNGDLRYSLRGENELQYDFGNQWSGNLNFFYWGRHKETAYLPGLGLQYNHFGQDRQYGIVQAESGGSFWHLSASLDVYFPRFYLNSFLQMPLAQQIPQGQPYAGFSAGLGLGIYLGKGAMEEN